MAMPPMPEPNHASAVASAGTERAPPVSAAMGLSATTPIHAAPNDTPRMTSERLATIQDVRVSIEGVIRETRSIRPLVPAEAGSQCLAPGFPLSRESAELVQRSGANPNVSLKRA